MYYTCKYSYYTLPKNGNDEGLDITQGRALA